MSRILAAASLVAFAAVGSVSGCTRTTENENTPITSWNGIALNTYQRGLAADGTVSDADLNDAYQRAAECARADGWQVSVIPATPAGFALNVTFGPRDDGDAAMEKVTECEAEWVGPLSSIFVAHAAPTGVEREREFTKWQECMVSNGATIDGVHLGQPQAEMVTLLQDVNGRAYPDWDPAWQDCMDTYYAVLWPELFGAPTE